MLETYFRHRVNVSISIVSGKADIKGNFIFVVFSLFNLGVEGEKSN